MKRTLLRVTVTLAMVMVVASVSAFGQGKLKRQSFAIPFAFSVGNRVLPAGEYRVISESEFIRIQSKDGKHNIVALPVRAVGTNAVKVELTFQRYGDDYQLSQVWLADGIGREFKRQRPSNSDVSQNVSVVDIVAGN